MRRIAREESGFSLIELLVVISLSGIVMGATLTTFTQFEQTNVVHQRQTDAQEQVRTALAGVARELRNLASPTPERPLAIERNEPADVIFQSVTNSTVRRVRYCLDTAGKRLWRQLQLAPLTALPGTSCPDPSSGWSAGRVVAANVVNGARPVFDYNSTIRTAITEVGTTLWVDVNPGAPPLETSLQTSVFLRNQNRSPVAVFTASLSGTSIVLNGSSSDDPEGRALRYYWYDTAVTGIAGCPVLPQDLPQSGCVGAGIVFNYTPPAPGPRSVYLIVVDPGELTDQAATQSVCVPGGGPC
ncbi:MAG TPA: prepilin-type N-terminal cleavage/methylation domain-containing protein [Thermoleophilaceae bacterium]|nr:prepilin-type N-terminal cleavage/methylation domain-containing protein [Thermoleophilaceae bacterium]